MLGLIALAIACTEILKAFGLPGIYEALLHEKRDVTRCHETALALLMLASAVLVPLNLMLLYALGFAVNGLHQHFLLLSLLALRIPLDLAAVQPQAMLVKQFAYRRLSLRSVVANVLAGAGGVSIAMLAEPLAGLVVYQVGQAFLSFLGTALGVGVLARPRIHLDCYRRLRRETMFATGNRVLAATINYVDQMMIAPLAGGTGLAFYNLGKRLETTFVTIANSFSSILFQPLFAAEAAMSRQKATSRALLVLALVCGTPAAVIFCNSRLVVGLIFGHNWVDAAPVVGWLCLNGLIRAIGMVPGSFLSVSGRNRELLVTSIVSAAGSLVLVLALARTSLTFCAASLAVKNAAIVAWMAWLTRTQVRQVGSTYLTAAIIPAGLMIGTAGLASLAVSPQGGLIAAYSGLAMCGAAVLGCCGLWVVIAFGRSLRGLLSAAGDPA